MNKNTMKKNIRHFIILSALAAGTIHLFNRFVDITAEMKNILKTDNGDYYDWKNGKIYYTKRGSGSPILLIHDLNPLSSSYEWCRFAKKLEKEYTVYTIDLLGCGRSDKPYLTYTNYLYVQMITDFVNHVIKDQPDVITTGGSISFVTLAANIEKDLFGRIIAINPPQPESFIGTGNHYATVNKTMLELPIIGTFIYNVMTHEKVIQKIFYDKYFYKPQIVSSKMLDGYYEAAHIKCSHGKYLMASLCGNYLDNAISHAVKKLEIPLYIIESRNNPDAISTSNSYTRLSSCVETAYISNTKMLPQLEAPDKTLGIVHMLLQK